MKVCSSCGKEGEDAYAICPYCGVAYEEFSAPANEAAAEAAEEPQAEEVVPAAAEESAAPNVREVTAEKETEKTAASFPIGKADGKTSEKAEKKNPFIINGIVAFFSLLLFIMTFFAGVKIAPALSAGGDAFAVAPQDGIDEESEALYGEPDGLNQSMTDILVGAFGLLETDKTKMAEYVSTAYKRFAEGLEDALKKYEKDIQALEKISDKEKYEKEAEKLYRKMVSYAASESDFNVVKVNYYMARLGLLGNGDPINAYAGLAVAVITAVLLLATLISAFLFAVLAAVALAKRRQVNRPFRALTTLLVLYLTVFALCSASPTAAANGVTVASVVLSLIGVLLLCAAERLLPERPPLTAKSLIRGGVSLLCAIFSFFLLCGTLFTVKSDKYTVNASMGLVIRVLLRGVAGGSETYAFGSPIGTAELSLFAVGLITWLCAILLTARGVLAAYADLYTSSDEYETKRGKRATSMGALIAAAVFAVGTLVLLFVALSPSKPSVSVGAVFVFVLLAGSATVKGLLPNELKAPDKEEDN